MVLPLSSCVGSVAAKPVMSDVLGIVLCFFRRVCFIVNPCRDRLVGWLKRSSRAVPMRMIRSNAINPQVPQQDLHPPASFVLHETFRWPIQISACHGAYTTFPPLPHHSHCRRNFKNISLEALLDRPHSLYTFLTSPTFLPPMRVASSRSWALVRLSDSFSDWMKNDGRHARRLLYSSGHQPFCIEILDASLEARSPSVPTVQNDTRRGERTRRNDTTKKNQPSHEEQRRCGFLHKTGGEPSGSSSVDASRCIPVGPVVVVYAQCWSSRGGLLLVGQLARRLCPETKDGGRCRRGHRDDQGSCAGQPYHALHEGKPVHAHVRLFGSCGTSFAGRRCRLFVSQCSGLSIHPGRCQEVLVSFIPTMMIRWIYLSVYMCVCVCVCVCDDDGDSNNLEACLDSLVLNRY